MILTSVHVKNFKSIRDSNKFKIDERVTCLVGKNEAGKTALLQAIEKLNPVESGVANFDDLDFPRHLLNEYQESEEYADALFTTWTLSKDDTNELEKVIGRTAKNIQTVEISKGYGNELQFIITVDEQAIVEHLFQQHELMQDERDSLQGVVSVIELRKALAALPDPSQRQKDVLNTISTVFKEDGGKEAVDAVLRNRLPKIAYFSEYLRMPGQVSVTDIKNRQANNTLKPEHKVFLALVTMVGRTLEDLEKITQHERLKADLEGASNRISRDIFRYWSQNKHLKVQFIFEQAMSGDVPPFNSGWIVRTRIENLRHGVTTSFDQRSAGFVWFFSFLVWFSQIKKQCGERVIILLDEPGLSLHAKAQDDLLRYIEEKLAPHYQVIYTTHSPFMIDPTNLLRARTVEDVFIESRDDKDFPDEQDLGTKVGDEVLSTDRDTVFPLQACLGYEISQTLFVGKHTILVEGSSEILYFDWFKKKLASLGRPTLDKRWVISPCGGITKIPAFLSLFSGNKLHIAVMTDFAHGEKRQVRELKESKLLQAGHVLTADVYAGQPEADIEDILGRNFYIELVSQAFELDSRSKLPKSRPKDAPIRVVKEVEAHFRTLTSSVPEFDHYFPSEFLIKQGITYTPSGLDEALDRFEKVFQDLNAML